MTADYDLLVIDGGISGAGIARDTAEDPDLRKG